MRFVALRALLIVAVAMLVFESSSVHARGPGGGGGRAGGGPGKQGPDFTKKNRKKKDVSKFNAGGLNNNGLGSAGLPNATATKFDGLPGNFKDGNFKPQQLQSQQFDAKQKWQSRDGQATQNLQNSIKDFKNGPQPFTAQWYADHPNAWQSTHPHADAWAAASAAGVAAWLGWGTQPVYYDTPDTVVYQENVYQDAPAEESNADDDVAANSTETNDNESQWLSIGVYSVLTNSGEPTSRYLQLAANHQGELSGVYYDSISGTSQNLSGRIDQATQTAQWSFDSNSKVTFRAGLNDLTQPTGTIDVNSSTGRQAWRIARQESSD